MNGKRRINVATLGLVDSGKTILIANTLVQLNPSNRKFNAFNSDNPKYNKYFLLTRILDRTRDEQERGITIHPSVCNLETLNKSITIIDTPGHKNFHKNVIRSISQVECIILTVDASLYKNYSTFSLYFEELENKLVYSKVFGIENIIVTITKMDSKEVLYSERIYNQLVDKIKVLLRKLKYNSDNITYLPVSGFEGDNIIENTKNLCWWKGLTFVQALDNIRNPKRNLKLPFILPITNCFKISGIGTVVVGRVTCGKLKLGCSISNGDTEIFVSSIEYHYKTQEEALHGDFVGLCLMGVPKKLIKYGNVLYSPNDLIKKVTVFQANIIIIKQLGNIKERYSSQLFCHTARVQCKLMKIIKKTGKQRSLQNKHQKMESNDYLYVGDIVDVLFQTLSPITLTTYDTIPHLGRFLLTDSGCTIGFGKVTNLNPLYSSSQCNTNSIQSGRRTKGVKI